MKAGVLLLKATLRRLCFQVLECIKISEETTTSSSRIFVKILFQELCAYMGLPRLNQRFKDM